MSNDRRVIVIGSGPVGSIAALALLQKGIPVTMLESGTELPDGALVRMMGKTVYRRRSPVPDKDHVASDDPTTTWFHAFVPGGLTNYWAGAVPRFAPEDFFEGERLGELYRWPVSYEDLVPYYEYVERLAGITGNSQDVLNLPACVVRKAQRLPGDWQQVARHASAQGHGLASLPLADVRPWMMARSGAAFNSFTQIIPLLQKYPHFELCLGAHALRLEWDGRSRRVRSVHYFDRTTRSERQITAAAAVLAAGPLSSTKILLDSACGDFPHGLGNEEGLLGHYLHDHLKDWCIVELDRPLSRLSHNAYLTRGPYEDAAPLLAAGYTIGNTSNRDRVLSIAGVKTQVFGTQIFSTMVPLERNSVLSHPELKDEFGLSKLDVHIRFDDDARDTLAGAREKILDVLSSAGYHGTIHSQMALSPGTSVHFGGTVRMHESPRYGMLNAWNRLHAIDNVVVADASAFTTGPEKNPTLTAMALAARASVQLAADLKGSPWHGKMGNLTSPQLQPTA